MAKRVFSRVRSPRKRSSEFSSVSDGGMFESRPFVVQSKVGEEGEKSIQQTSDLKTQLIRATRFGHNLSQMPAVQNKAPIRLENHAIHSQVEEKPKQINLEENQLLSQKSGLPVQPKVTIRESKKQYEQETDLIPHQVLEQIHTPSSRPIQLSGDYSGLLPEHETYSDSYTYNGKEKEDKFTYHHIIPENKLHGVVKKLRTILENSDNESFKDSVSNLKKNAQKQWLSTRAKNTTSAINKEFNDFNVKFNESQIKEILGKHEELDPLFDEIKNLISNQKKQEFRSQISTLIKQVKVLLNNDDFINAWSNGEQGILTSHLEDIFNQDIFELEKVKQIFLETKPNEKLKKNQKAKQLGSNKGKVVENLENYLQKEAFDNYYSQKYEKIDKESTSKGYLKRILQDKALPKSEDQLSDAVTWNPGNIHRGPSSSFRLNPEDKKDFLDLVDDGGDSFEIAAINLVKLEHYKVLHNLNTALDNFLKLPENNSEELVQEANKIVGQMVEIQNFGLTAYNEENWKQEKVNDQNKMRIKINNDKVKAATEQGLINK